MAILTIYFWAFVVSLIVFLLYLVKINKMPAPPFIIIFSFLLSKVGNIQIPRAALEVIVALTFPLIIFDIFSRMHTKKFDSITWHAIEASTYLLIFSAIVIGIVGYSLISFESIFITIILGIFLLAASDFDIPLRKCSRAIEKFIYDESIMSSAITLIFIFVLAQIKVFGLFQSVMNIFLGFGTGAVAGLLIFRAVKIRWTRSFSHHILLASTIFTYAFARVIGASPVIAVATMGYFFGNVTISNREQLHEFGDKISNIIEVILFFILPLVVAVDFSWNMFLMAFILIMFYFARYFSLSAASHHEFSLLERIFLTFYNPKGSATIAALLAIFLLNPDGFQPLYPIMMFMIIVSVIVSGFVAHYGHRFSKMIK